MKISVICPFYNESLIIERAAQEMIRNLETLGAPWELIIVNDGSKDHSVDLALKMLKDTFPNYFSGLIEFNSDARAFAVEDTKWPRVKILSYPTNRGRGHALQAGISLAQGDILVTTEIDLSWGNRIVHEIVDYFQKHPMTDVVVGSPNLPGGGYKNVPFRRVLISRLGNRLIRLLFPVEITMNTGMTRGYKRKVIQSLQFEENGKEFHLETLLKLSFLGFQIREIPAVLEWKDSKLQNPSGPKRKSSTKIRKIAWSHLNFLMFANPIRYFWAFSFISAIGSSVFAAFAFRALLFHNIAIYYLIVAFFLALFSLLFFSFGVITAQNSKILKELWKGH